MELALYADTITLDYDIWRQRLVEGQLTSPTDYAFQNLFSEEMSSELEMARHKFKQLITSQSDRQELKGKIQDLENTLQAHQQHLNDLLRALEEKNGQHDRNICAYETAPQEKDMHVSSLVNEIRKVAVQIVQLLD
ncbi:hypothetical protein Gogos_021207 [Gossypium gossypioides]|uniref:Uncharacterized protein n=1 Tax=Gossypium gossypioides TaxID=34282 RepID=A0A7J9CZG3_GOSGO|nr:hypothetical protein [Gossypium gossypioides]